MSSLLNSIKGGFIEGIIQATTIGATRSLDYSSDVGSLWFATAHLIFR